MLGQPDSAEVAGIAENEPFTAWRTERANPGFDVRDPSGQTARPSLYKKVLAAHLRI
jgi:hypothetical protein